MHVQTKQLLRVLLTAFVAVGLSTSAAAADVVDVRIGTHPTYTRVVFELDAASGYSVERQLAEDGVAQLLVTMDAGSAPRSLDSRSVMVERVAVQDSADRATAHIRLKHKPARLKELILTNPPRIVFDFGYPDAIVAARKAAAEKRAAAKAAKATAVAKTDSQPQAVESVPAPTPRAQASAAKPQPKQAAARTEKPAATPKRVAAKPTASPAPTAVAKPKPAEKAAPTAVAKKTPTAKPAPTAVAKTTPAAKPTPTAVPAPKPTAVPAPKPAPIAAADSKPSASPSTEAAAKKQASLVAEPVENAAKPEVADPKSAEAAAADVVEGDVAQAIREAAGANSDQATERVAEANEKPSSLLPAAPASPAQESSLDWTLVSGVAAGALALFVAFFLWNRRRALPNDIDVTALADAAASDDDSASQEFAMGVEEPESSDSLFDDNAPAAAAPQVEPVIAADPGLSADDESAKENDAMDLENPDLPMERTASEMPTQMGIGVDASSNAGGDVAGMLREFESRLVKLETQLDETNDARERLERQVTAQAEELRVQRAAIARTQRALRGMNRGEGEQATEPAIREPNS